MNTVCIYSLSIASAFRTMTVRERYRPSPAQPRWLARLLSWL